MKRKSGVMRGLALGVILLLFVVVVPAQASYVSYTSQSSWESALTSYSSTDLSSLTEYSSYSSVDMGDGQTLWFSSSLEAYVIGSSWSTWHGTYPTVLYSSENSLTGTWDTGYNAFGFYVEPNNYETYTFTFTTASGTYSVDIAGYAGATFIGFISDEIILSWTLSTSSDAGGFAIGELEYGTTATSAAVPEPATMLLLGFGLAGVAVARKKFRG